VYLTEDGWAHVFALTTIRRGLMLIQVVNGTSATCAVTDAVIVELEGISLWCHARQASPQLR